MEFPEELVVRENESGWTFEVRVAPRASRNRVLGIYDGKLKVSLTAAPVDGEANASLRKLLSKHFHVAKSLVEFLQGKQSKNKVIRIRRST